MADSDRIKDRHGQSAPRATSSGGGGSFLSRHVFGRASATTKITTGQDNITPQSPQQTLPYSSGRASATEEPASTKNTHFHLDEVLRLMDPGASTFASISGPELVEYVKATAVYLGIVADEEPDIFSPPTEGKRNVFQLSPENVKTLYHHTIAFADRGTEIPLRVAGLRLLASLISVYPPPRYLSEHSSSQVSLPRTITTRSLYGMVIGPSDIEVLPEYKLELLGVQVEALRVLTRSGEDVEGMVGILGWLVRQLGSIKEEWSAWCASNERVQRGNVKLKPFDPIRTPTSFEVALSIIDLLRGISLSSIALLDPSDDIPRLIRPVIGFVAKGIVASNPSEVTISDVIQSRRESAIQSSVHTPVPHSTSPVQPSVIESSIRRAVSKPRRKEIPIFTSPLSRPARQSSTNSNKSSHSAIQSPVPLTPSSTPLSKWLYLIPSVCAFFNIFIEATVLPIDTFNEIMRFNCVCISYDDEPSDNGSHTAVYRLLDTMFRSNGGRKGKQALRVSLEEEITDDFRKTYEGMDGVDVKVVQGAVFVARTILLHLDDFSDAPTPQGLPTSSLSSLSSSLVAALSTSRFREPEKRSERSRWEPVDFAVLALLQDYLHRSKEMTPERIKEVKGDVWTEGQAACDILQALVPVAYPTIESGYSLGLEQMSSFAFVFDEICHLIPSALKPLVPARLEKRFTHPSYIKLLLSFETLLQEDDAAVIIDYYRMNGLCMPTADAWIDNTWKLLDLFYLSSIDLPEARKRLATFLFDGIYAHTEQLSQPRDQVVARVIVPFLEKSLLRQREDWFRQSALDVLVKAAVMETFERDEERRRVRSEKEESEVQAEDASALPSQEVKDAAAGGSFHAIRALIISLASSAWCKDDEYIPPRAEIKRPMLPPIPPPAPTREASARDSISGATGLKGLMNALSPPSRTKELPSISAPLSSTHMDEQEHDRSSQSPPSQRTHTKCHSLYAVRALIMIFNQLAFSPPHSLASTAKAARTPASSRCITIYRDLLGLLYPLAEHAGNSTPTSRVAAVHAKCPKARLTILQWLFRLRADPRHRIYLRPAADVVIRPFAETLCRTKENIEAQRAALIADAEEARARVRARHAHAGPRENVRERASASAANRSRSRSRPAGNDASAADYNPLWSVPETLAFEMPTERLPSEGLLTYDPNHPSLRVKDAPPVESVWLPVSEYVACINGILRHEKNWEIVSYVLCFLPLQLSNKLFFRGGRATAEVKQLLKELCSTIQQDNRIERRCKHHTFIKRPNVNAAVYQALTILVSYKDVLEISECDRLVAAFETCLESNTIVAKPCIQGLTLCVFELDISVGKRLLPIIGKLRDINLTSGIAVHLLEFILALGQHHSLFRNFTDAHYKDVFTLVIDYIAEHNARSDDLPDMTPDTRESYTLSQHVIGLAYHAIYVWFLALKLALRPDLVRHIIVKLLQSRSKRVLVDEMAEVCLDWLARYTYGNADPKPATSFLSEMVMQENGQNEKPKKQSWFLGGAIVTITSHPRSGWASITSTRPTGTTEVIAKLENVPLLGLGEQNADLFSLPAALMANRQAIMKDEEQVTMRDIVRPAEIEEGLEETNEDGRQYIWSGVTPSQRRKDVAVDPAYLAVELLSSYPNASLDAPRGQIIPNEEKFNRSLRTIENTPVIDTAKLGVLYVAPGQTNELDILGNIDGSSLYLDFLAGLGRLIRLKGQVDVFTGGLNRTDDSDGEYAYAWWDDLTQTIFHTATMMPNKTTDPKHDHKKRLLGNDYVKIIYNDSGVDFAFDTIKTAFNFINIVISPHTTPETHGPAPQANSGDNEGWAIWGRDDYFKVLVQRAPGIPDFSPVGEMRIVSKNTLPGFVRHVALMANEMAAKFAHIRNARNPAEAEYITSWRSRLRTMNRLREGLPPLENIDPADELKREEVLRDFTWLFSQRLTSEQT